MLVVAVADIVELVILLLDGVCHVAIVLLVAVSTCPLVGDVAVATSILVDAECRLLAVTSFVVAVIVLLVNVCVSVVPTTVSVGAPVKLPIVIEPSCCVIFDAVIRASAKVPDVTSAAAIVNVFDAVFIVLFVKVCVSETPTIALVIEFRY